MTVYKPYIKKSNDTVEELPLYATTAGEVVNLGYYDTITENSDGTYTITRQTGYLVLDGVKHKFNAKFDNTRNGEYYYNELINYISKPSSPSIIGSIISNTLKTLSADNLYINNTYGIAVDARGYILVGLTTAIDTLDKANAYLLQNPISIQYKLATATTEKVEEKHYARYNERFILEHNRTESEKSANLLNTFDRSNIPSISSLYAATLNSDGSYTSTATSDSRAWTYANSDFKFHLPKGVYTFSVTGKTISSDSNTGMRVIASNDSALCTAHPGNGFKNSFTLTSDTDVGVLIKSYTSEDLKIMLNEGSVALQYQPYNQNKHITNSEAVFLKNESERSANVFDINTVTIGNGYDYTATATDWVKAIDIPVEPKTTYTASSIIAKYAFNHGNIVSDYNKNTITTGNDTTSLSLFMYVGDYSGTVNAWFSNYMFNEGSVALPYQPYEGKVIHEKDLKNVSTNLGYYDTITENADGSYTITRQTGYINGKDFLNRSANGVGNPYVTFEHVKVNKNIENIIGNCSRVGPDSWWNSTFTQVTITYDANYDFLVVLLPNGTAENDITPLNDIRIQYKLPNKRTEKVEKNYCAQYNKRFILEHNKREAAKSSNLWSYENNITINAGSESWWTLSNATMDAWGLVVGETYSIKSFVNNDTRNLAFQILPGWSDFKDGRTFVFTSDTQIRIGGNTVASKVTFTPKIMLVKGIDIADEYQPYSGAPIHKKEFEDFKNSMKFIPYVSEVETNTSKDISENGTYFVIPTDPSSASLKLQVEAGPHGTLQTAYFSGGIISVFSFYDSKFQTCGVQITYGAGSSLDSIQIADSYSPAGSSSGVISRVIGKCKIYKL